MSSNINLPFGYKIGRNSNRNSNSNRSLNQNNSSNRGNNSSNRGNQSGLLDKIKKVFYYNELSLWWILFYILLLIIVVYFVAFTIKYSTTKCNNCDTLCEKKRRYGAYLFRFRWNDVCYTEYKKEGEDLSNIAYMNDSPTSENKVPEAIETDLDKLEGKPQVFHIANQDYTYDQAQCKCASYNATLASYSDLVEAYNKGANWCSYGWSKGQTAYYPTQKCIWEKMQSTDKKNDCGKPGINGGFFGDPYLKFGVNCFGKKPEGKIVKLEDKKCPNGAKQPYCEMPQNYFASHRLKTDEISPFNDEKWNEYDK